MARQRRGIFLGPVPPAVRSWLERANTLDSSTVESNSDGVVEPTVAPLANSRKRTWQERGDVRDSFIAESNSAGSDSAGVVEHTVASQRVYAAAIDRHWRPSRGRSVSPSDDRGRSLRASSQMSGQFRDQQSPTP